MITDGNGPQELDALAALKQRVQLLEAALHALPSSISIWKLDQVDDATSLRLVAANPAVRQVIGIDFGARIGERLVDIFPDDPSRLYDVYAAVIRSGQARSLGEMTYTDAQLGEVTILLQAIPLPDHHLLLLSQNVTDQRRAEEALRQSMALEATLQAQQATMAELSTPLIPISDDVMVMPLVGSVDSRRAQQVMESLLEGVAQSRARVAILDITGVPVVDTQVANALIRAAQSVKLLGAQVILTGIRPEVAQTLVGLGADLSAITTHSSLQSGIAYATARR